MALRNQNWYDLNESRPWPVDDSAKLLDRDGARLSHDLIVDLYMRFPQELGERAYISSITISPGIVTVNLLGTGPNFAPMAAITLRRPVEPYRQYELDSLYKGVGGWIVFGSGIRDTTNNRLVFDDSLQSLLLAQTARKYLKLPVYSIGKLFAEPGLTGLVKLSGGNDIEIVREEIEINEVVRDAAVVRLKNKRTTGDSRNLLEIYAGTCGQRPESLNCGDPEPIQSINTVVPDCCGNINVEFRGCGDVSSIEGECGVVVDCGFGLGAACKTEDRLPDSDGRLPNEYVDQCIDHSESFDPAAPPPDVREYAPKSKLFPGSQLPYFEDFSDSVAEDFEITSGEFIIVQGGNGSGTVLTIRQNGGNPNVIVAFGESPAAGLPLKFSVEGNTLPGYNTTHNFDSAVDERTLISDVAYVSDGDGGTWEEIATGGSGTAGIVWEAQEDLENVALWKLGLPEAVDWECTWKKIIVPLSIKEGSTGTKDNAGVVFNHRPTVLDPTVTEFWLAEINWTNSKTFNLLHRSGSTWRVYGSQELLEMDQHKRYQIEIEILPLDEDGSSLHAYVRARVIGIDDGLFSELGPVVLPFYYPANGYFGFYSDRSLSWFESMRVEDYSP